MVLYRAGKAGGYLGVLTALVAYYIGLAQLLLSEKNPTLMLPLGNFD
jgi:succinate-acetate transporter protein